MATLERGQIVDQPLGEGHDLCTQPLNVANPLRADPLDPFLSSLRVTQLAGAVVVAARSWDLLGLHVPTGPNRPKRPVIGVDHDGVPRLVRRTLVEVGPKRFRIRTRVARSYHSRPSQVTQYFLIAFEKHSIG